MADEKKTPGIPSFIDSLDFGVVLIDRDLKVLWLNNAMERLFGITRASTHGQDVFTFFNSHIAPRLTEDEQMREQVFSSLASGNPIQTREVRLISSTGQPMWVEYSSQVIEHGPFKGMRLDIFQDITLRVLLQREIDKHVEQLGTLTGEKEAEQAKVSEQHLKETTERSKVEGPLSWEREFSARLLEMSPIFLLALDKEGSVLLASSSLLRALGYGKEDLLGKSFLTTIIVPEDRDQAMKGFHQAIESKTGGIGESRIQARDGKFISVEWYYRPVLDEEGSFGYLLIAGTDITERKSMIESLRTSEGLYRIIFETTLAATAILTDDTSIYRANTELEKITGYSRGAMEGKRLIDLVIPEERKKLLQVLRSQGGSCECVLQDGNGRHRDIIIALAPIPGGKRYIASFLDITERKQAEKELAEKNYSLSVLHEVITAATSSQKLEDNLTTLLAKSLQVMTLDAGAVYLIERKGKSARLTAQSGMPEWMTSEAQSLSILEPPYRAIFIDGKTEYLEKKDTGLLSLAWIPFLANNQVIGAVYLMTGRKDSFSEGERRILESLSREVGNALAWGLLKEELAESNTLSNLYLDIMTHDINNANTVSLMYAELLVEILDGEKKEMAEKLTAGIRRSTGILSNVSTMRKIREEKTPLQPISLDEVIAAEMKGFPRAHILYTPMGITVCADPLLSEVFANLIGNGMKFGGKDVQITISLVDAENEVEVAIADTGPGIPDSLKPLLFRRFERGQTKVRGKGLGLYLCRMLIERYGGKIWVEDRVPGHSERGAIFKFLLKKEPCQE